MWPVDVPGKGVSDQGDEEDVTKVERDGCRVFQGVLGRWY